MFIILTLFITNKVFAGADFNGASNDCPTVIVANFTQNDGFSNECWLNNVSANPGDTINVRIYYHNTGDQPAQDTFVKMTPVVGGSKTVWNFSGSVSASNASYSYGSTSVTLSSSQTLTAGRVLWHPNGVYNGIPLPFGQSDSDVFTSGGVRVGTVNPGWNTVGSVVVAFTVGNYVAPQPITYQCNDGIDNDLDGLVDYPQDNGCGGVTDNTEYLYVAPVVVAPVIPKTTYVNVYTNTGNGNSHISLKVDSSYKNACVGDTNSYTISYKNISGKILNNATLRIELPKEITFKRSSDGRFNQTDNTLTIQIGTLTPNQEDSINLEGTIIRPKGNDTLLVVTATMVYTNGNNQENAIAYGLSDMSQCLSSNQTASSIFGFGLFPTSLWGWLLLLLLILLIVFLARRYATKTTTKTTTTSTSLE